MMGKTHSVSSALPTMQNIESMGTITLASSTPRVLVSLRLVTATVLLALLWKWSFFQSAQMVYAQYPLQDDFFPAWLRSVWTLRIAFVTTVGSLVWVFVTSSAVARKRASLIAWIASTVLVWHQGSHNDMTFVTGWWACLWLAWFSARMASIEDLRSEQGRADGHQLMQRAAFLSRLIVSLMLLGGAVGKWTSEYWSGQVFYEIYFVDRDYWIFNWLRTHFEDAELREIAMWYSRQAIVVETLAGLFLWRLPARWAAAGGIIIFGSIAVLSNVLLFSVLLSMMGLAAVGLLIGPERSQREMESSPRAA